MVNNYDMEPVKTPPWWPGVFALFVLAVVILTILWCY